MHKRLALTRVGPATGEPLPVADDKKKNGAAEQKSYRMTVKLKEPSAKEFNEFFYSDLLEDEEAKDPNRKQNPDDPFDDPHEERKLQALAAGFEAKYGGGGAKRRRRRAWEDMVDKGQGYDETDPFIDNDEAYDELLPSTMTTKLGGFYINAGELEFKELTESESSESEEDEPIRGAKKRPLFKNGAGLPASKKNRMANGDKAVVNGAASHATKPVNGADKPKKKYSVADLIAAKQKKKSAIFMDSGLSEKHKRLKNTSRPSPPPLKERPRQSDVMRDRLAAIARSEAENKKGSDANGNAADSQRPTTSKASDKVASMIADARKVQANKQMMKQHQQQFLQSMVKTEPNVQQRSSPHQRSSPFPQHQQQQPKSTQSANNPLSVASLIGNSHRSSPLPQSQSQRKSGALDSVDYSRGGDMMMEKIIQQQLAMSGMSNVNRAQITKSQAERKQSTPKPPTSSHQSQQQALPTTIDMSSKIEAEIMRKLSESSAFSGQSLMRPPSSKLEPPPRSSSSSHQSSTPSSKMQHSRVVQNSSGAGGQHQMIKGLPPPAHSSSSGGSQQQARSSKPEQSPSSSSPQQAPKRSSMSGDGALSPARPPSRPVSSSMPSSTPVDRPAVVTSVMSEYLSMLQNYHHPFASSLASAISAASTASMPPSSRATNTTASSQMAYLAGLHSYAQSPHNQRQN